MLTSLNSSNSCNSLLRVECRAVVLYCFLILQRMRRIGFWAKVPAVFGESACSFVQKCQQFLAKVPAVLCKSASVFGKSASSFVRKCLSFWQKCQRCRAEAGGMRIGWGWGERRRRQGWRSEEACFDSALQRYKSLRIHASLSLRFPESVVPHPVFFIS